MEPITTSRIFVDLTTEELVQLAVERGEGIVSNTGALAAATGSRTGRSPKDRFIVKDTLTANTVDWGTVNQPIDLSVFNALWNKATQYLSDKELFVSHLRVGEDPKYFIPLKVITDKAWHNLFARHLFLRPSGDYAAGKKPWALLNASGLKTDPKIDGTRSDATLMIDFSGKRVLLCGLEYAGEMKKAMFSILNYFLPAEDVLPMHCSANVGEDGDVALFFGLSGTGKTTLSADPDRYLIGDDEHGWSNKGVFNFEGGCYAKCIDLSKEREPIIWDAIRSGAIMENVILDEKTKVADYSDARLTQNTRAAYPREYIPKRVLENYAGPPKSVIFLTCDLYGVLPPVALLTKEQAAYYFLSGYTALVGSTEMGSTAAISSTFSTCFGAPFFPRAATVYANLLIKRIEETGCQVYLINTGWTGGAYGEGGQRFDIPTTRAVVKAALSGDLINAPQSLLPGLNLHIPKHLTSVDDRLLDPRTLWSSKTPYQTYLNQIIEKFIENFKKFKDVPVAIQNAGPKKIA